MWTQTLPIYIYYYLFILSTTSSCRLVYEQKSWQWHKFRFLHFNTSVFIWIILQIVLDYVSIIQKTVQKSLAIPFLKSILLFHEFESQYLRWPPLYFNKIWTYSGKLSYNFTKLSSGIIPQTFWRTFRKSGLFLFLKDVIFICCI